MDAQSYQNSFTVFDGSNHLLTGSIHEVALAAKRAIEGNHSEMPMLIFSNATGHSIDIDTSGDEEQVLARLAAPAVSDSNEPEVAEEKKKPRRGRPKLGVVAREVTLLPRHWAWLADQPGGASVTLRKLVDSARKSSAEAVDNRNATSRAYHFMSAIAGNLPGFEEASRALFADDRQKFAEQVSDWPVDIRNHASWLAFGRVRLQPYIENSN